MCGQSERVAERQRYRQGGGGGKKRGERIGSSAAEGRREEEYSEARELRASGDDGPLERGRGWSTGIWVLELGGAEGK